MDLNLDKQDEAFRQAARRWLAENLSGDFEKLRGRGGPGDENTFFPERILWEQHLAQAGWTCLGWEYKYGGQEKSFIQQMLFHEEYARARAPGRTGLIGEGLLGPTLIAFGTQVQKEFFLPAIAAGKTVWCQGYSEPDAGSDLANIQTKATLKNGNWIIEGRKIWTSLAHLADWCFVLARCEPHTQCEPRPRRASRTKGRAGLVYLLVPLQQKNITITPIKQMTGDSEFNEILFDGAQTDAENIVGKEGEGWRIAMGTLAFERGVSTLGQQMNFRADFEEVLSAAKANGSINDIVIRQRLVQSWMELVIMRVNALRMLSPQAATAELTREAYIYKIYWASWHRALGKLAMDVLGEEADCLAQAPYGLTRLQRLFLFTRADTIYGGTNQIQRNIIAERALGMPREPHGDEINLGTRR